MARMTAATREAALDRAMTLFWRRGYHATSLKDLERALDMRPGSIYAAFTSKERLFREALDRYAARTGEAFGETERAESPLQGLADHIRAMGRGLDDDPPARACMLVKTLLETTEEERELREAAEARLAEIQRRFAERFAAARAAGELPPEADPERLARRLQAEVMGLKVYAQRAESPQELREIAEDIAQGLEAMAARPAAQAG